MKHGLTDQQLSLLFEIVISPLKEQGATVWIFGSRARGDHKSFSDVDLLYELQKEKALPPGFMSRIREVIEESSFPFKVDLVNLNEMADSYKIGAMADRVLL
jgi:predicted nucleotidyltransferase